MTLNNTLCIDIKEQYIHCIVPFLNLSLWHIITLKYWQNQNLKLHWSRDIKYWFHHYDGSQKQKINFIWKSIFNSVNTDPTHRHKSISCSSSSSSPPSPTASSLANKDNDRLHLTGKQYVTCANEILPLRLWLGDLADKDKVHMLFRLDSRSAERDDLHHDLCCSSLRCSSEISCYIRNIEKKNPSELVSRETFWERSFVHHITPSTKLLFGLDKCSLWNPHTILFWHMESLGNRNPWNKAFLTSELVISECY